MTLLPEIDYPIYTVTLPISKTEIKIRPYYVKEQKLLMMAVESVDRKYLMDTIAQIVSNCVVSDINVNSLPITDVEYIFYNLRARSESETVPLRYRCESVSDNGEYCGNIMEKKLNLLTDLEITDGVSPIINIDDITSVKMKYSKFEYSTLDEKEILTPEELFEVAAKQIEFISIKDSIYSAADTPLKDIISWLERLTVEQYTKIENFLINEPKIHKNISMTCSKCGTVHDIDIGDIFDFFI